MCIVVSYCDDVGDCWGFSGEGDGRCGCDYVLYFSENVGVVGCVWVVCCFICEIVYVSVIFGEECYVCFVCCVLVVCVVDFFVEVVWVDCGCFCCVVVWVVVFDCLLIVWCFCGVWLCYLLF